MSNFTDKLEACYQARNYDRTSFAKAAGLKESTIRNWIRTGFVPSAEVVYKISKFFGVPMEYFMDGEEIPFTDREIGLIIKMKSLTDEQLKMISYMIEKFEDENKKVDK